MRNSRLWARALGVVVVLTAVTGVSAAQPAGAQLPTSSSPPKGVWSEMTPSTFTGTTASAVAQCERDARLDKSGALTEEKCTLLGEQLSTGRCESVMVPDGIVFDYLNGRRAGRSHVWFRMEKKIGRSDRALLCDVGGGVQIYWFTGDRGRSCNNIAVIMPVAIEIECREVPLQGNTLPLDESFQLNSVYHESCCCDGDGMYTPSLTVDFDQSPIRSSGSTEECWPVNQPAQ